jgi:hypothetical protein
MRGTTRGQLAALAASALALAASGCTEERKLSADEFVADVNEQGVALTLGEPLHTEDEGKELYAVGPGATGSRQARRARGGTRG